jgi:hypothetical protein
MRVLLDDRLSYLRILMTTPQGAAAAAAAPASATASSSGSSADAGANSGPAGAAGGEGPREWVVLNEVVIDRGISPFLTNLECYCDGALVTHVQARGPLQPCARACAPPWAQCAVQPRSFNEERRPGRALPSKGIRSHRTCSQAPGRGPARASRLRRATGSSCPRPRAAPPTTWRLAKSP